MKKNTIEQKKKESRNGNRIQQQQKRIRQNKIIPKITILLS